MIRFASRNTGRLLVGISWAVLAMVADAAMAQSSGPPDVSGILEYARIAPEKVLFEEDFEGTDAGKINEWYPGKVPHKILFSGVTTEQAFSGKHSYKLQIAFEAGRWGESYAVLPIQLPVWSDMKVTMHIKAQQPGRTWCFHGFEYGEAEQGFSSSVVNGHKVGEKDGWEIWQATAKNNGGVGLYIEGPSVQFQLPDHSPATTVTLYVDKITITGRLPGNWKKQWADVYRYYTVDGEKVLRAAAARRLGALKAWYARCVNRLDSLPAVPDSNTLLLEQYNSLVRQSKADLAAVKPLLAVVENGLKDKKKRFTANINAPERTLMLTRHYLDLAGSLPAYAADHPDPDVILYAVDVTQSYPILPSGPMAHNEELSYYDWGEKGVGLENPQILPGTTPVPARPSRRLENFGCPGIFVPFSFALRTAKTLDNLTFTIGDLKAPGGTIPASAVDLRVVAPWLRPFGGKPRLMNDMLLHDPEFVVPLAGQNKNKFRDARFGHDTDRLLPVTVPAGTNRQFYALVRVPNDAAAGTYCGSITGTTMQGKTLTWELQLEVLPFDLEPTPFAYWTYYNTYLWDNATNTWVWPIVKDQGEGIHSYRTRSPQMKADFQNMFDHGMNTLNVNTNLAPLPVPDFKLLDKWLSMGTKAGLTRSPFVWTGTSIFYYPDPRPLAPHTPEEVIKQVTDIVTKVNKFCRDRGYPRPAFYGYDEANGEELIKLAPGYSAVNKAGGIITVACSSANYFSEIGTALSLPIVYGGTQTLQGERGIRASQKAGYDCWIYNVPCSNMAATPSVYRRRYGLALWKNNEQGAAPWCYSMIPYKETDPPCYRNEFTNPVYAFTYPVWSGRPIDTVIWEAYREGVYDTRYLTTLQKSLAKAKSVKAKAELVAEIEGWLTKLSVHDDLQRVRRQMADYIIKLSG